MKKVLRLINLLACVFIIFHIFNILINGLGISNNYSYANLAIDLSLLVWLLITLIIEFIRWEGQEND